MRYRSRFWIPKLLVAVLSVSQRIQPPRDTIKLLSAIHLSIKLSKHAFQVCLTPAVLACNRDESKTGTKFSQFVP